MKRNLRSAAMACLLLPLSLYAQTDIDNEITVTDNDGN